MPMGHRVVPCRPAPLRNYFPGGAGTFIGGHTCFKASCPRDLFVRCDCPECSGLGDVTAEADGCGGRLLTLCMFERHGGKGASKKPLGSIKVVPEGGADHKSLGPWLDSKSRRAGAP